MKKKHPDPVPLKGNKEDFPETFGETFMRAFMFGVGGEYGKSYADLPAEKQRLIKGLGYYYAYFHNGYVLLEAFKLCKGVNPPVWVLESLSKCFDEFHSGKSLERAFALGAQNKNEYEDFRNEWRVMYEVWKKDQAGTAINHACQSVKDPEGRHPETIEKRYRDKGWKGFFEYVAQK